MKTLPLFTAFIITALSLNAQVPVTRWVGDTLGPWTVITFEEPTPYIQNIPTAGNIWRVGMPQKSFFNQAYTVPNAMVTDTINFYPDNNQSFFDLYIGNFNSNWSYFYNLFIDFRHKYDTDTLQDGGYITVSWDYGQSWMNILDDTISQQNFNVSPASQFWGMYGNTNLYTLNHHLYNGEHGYSGKSNGWVHSCMAWYDLPVEKSANYPPDTMIIRFNFISDNIHHNREGWMIDQIRIFSIDLGSGIRDFRAGNKKAFVAPNPIRSGSIVTLDKTYDNVGYLITDVAGKVVSQGFPGKCSTFQVPRGNISSGVYLLKINFNREFSESHQIILTE